MELWNFILEVQSLRANSGGAYVLDLGLNGSKNLVYSKIIKLSRPLRWQDLSHRSLLQVSSVLAISPNQL
jgi:hypothetical protein